MIILDSAEPIFILGPARQDIDNCLLFSTLTESEEYTTANILARGT